MRNTNCYMPEWNQAGKLMKHGSYTCWEAVVAHARELHGEGAAADLKVSRVCEYVNNLVGCVVNPAPHWSTLAWLQPCRGDIPADSASITTPQEFLTMCQDDRQIIAVRIPTDDVAHEVLCGKQDISTKFQAHLRKPFPEHYSEPQSFQTVRKKVNKDKDLTVFYYPFRNGLPFNSTASNAFKMQIYGDALVVQQSKEQCFMPRERYVSYPLLNFKEQFVMKHKRKEPSQVTLSVDEFDDIKAEMADQLQTFEQMTSSNAALPAELARASNLLPPTGMELANLLRDRGQSPPPKRSKQTSCDESAA